MVAGFSVTVLMVALEVVLDLGSVTLMVSVARSLTFWEAPRLRMSFWVCAPSLVSASSGATSKRSFLRARMRRPPEGLRVERPCQRDIRAPGSRPRDKEGVFSIERGEARKPGRDVDLGGTGASGQPGRREAVAAQLGQRRVGVGDARRQEVAVQLQGADAGE